VPSDDSRLDLVVGCTFGLSAPTATATVLQVAPSPQVDVQMCEESWTTGDTPHHTYLDSYGNRCERLLIPAGESTISYRAHLLHTDPHDSDPPTAAPETEPPDLPDETLPFLMPSRFCLPDELGSEAWERFGDVPGGGTRVQAVVDFVHELIEFVPGSSNPWTTAADVFRARQGVCRDYAHLAISLCRALNVPSRYVFGYISDVGAPEPVEPMDFAAWFEAYLDGEWRTFDPRNNRLRTGRVIVGRGRDAADVALITSLGSLGLTEFEVVASERPASS
jgi:transglutaminase-like putative cysteine protease